MGYLHPRPEGRLPGRLHGRSPEVVAVSAWSLVHGLSALWLSGRLAERITEQDPQRLAAAVSDLFVDAVLPPPGRTAGKAADLASRVSPG